MQCKITIVIPKGTRGIRSRLRAEIAETANVKDKETRTTALSALGQLVREIDDSPLSEGMVLKSDGNEILRELYVGRAFKYRCGREYLTIEEPKVVSMLLIVIDAKEATIGSSDGTNIEVLWSETSYVPNKHDMGGSSKARFQRSRENELLAWLRKVAEQLVNIWSENGVDILVGGCGMTKNKFIEELRPEMQDRILDIKSVGYTDENGLWEMLGKERYVKVLIPTQNA